MKKRLFEGLDQSMNPWNSRISHKVLECLYLHSTLFSKSEEYAATCTSFRMASLRADVVSISFPSLLYLTFFSLTILIYQKN